MRRSPLGIPTFFALQFSGNENIKCILIACCTMFGVDDDSYLEWWEILLITIGCLVTAAGGIVITIVIYRRHHMKKNTVVKETNASESRDLPFVCTLRKCLENS
jgi:hypothetical protein